MYFGIIMNKYIFLHIWSISVYCCHYAFHIDFGQWKTFHGGCFFFNVSANILIFFSQLYWDSVDKIVRYLKYTTWRLDIHIHCERISLQIKNNPSIILHSYCFGGVGWEHLKSTLLANFTYIIKYYQLK